jgi:hypothetical protein
MTSALIVPVEAISAFAAASLFYLTLKPCKASGISYLLGVPAGFGLLALAFIANTLCSVVITKPSPEGLLVTVVYFLMQTYGMLFLALTYARRTRLKFVGGSVSIELAIPTLITIAVVAYAVAYDRLQLQITTTIPTSMVISLRFVAALASAYLVYETSRNWSLTRRASEGIVIFGYAALLVEEVGFLLASQGFGDVATFLAYEGRFLGLFILIAITSFGIKRGDFATVLRRLGLTALAH